ncbi:MAG: hypothetical protein A3D64_02865 [Candidatus Wildermuthbacteria bacterium RIFCSPHIGHO2_02_FULL_49_9]|uniref:Uncharacterized protein n=2 Tax=Candidatus Wildermuthiibacteriota TaxID=1817923 RepID=A0A1G2QW30_9BACT|nr:MAG: hypothetical protein A2672_00380 [Candidatus Wildermuthbacteria bacterium RIFCSPHIGHO2_01_FULL_49_22b]OHA71184.1 MAG: hypothetical protein A3D64_02865 [Candidatus Wildermuthbacteria bacterium RIFCSPHIGHO2_02_FULL_49_9]
MNKTILIGVGVLLVVVVGGIFLYLLGASSPEEEHITTPTQWSQEGDYKIEETPQGTLVTNTAAGFSFKVPERWRLEGQRGELEGEYVLDILSADTTFEQSEDGTNIAILGGCILSLETEYQEDTVTTLSARMASVRENPDRYTRDTSKEDVIVVNGKAALQTSLMPPPDSDYYKQFGESVRIELPMDMEGVVRFGIRFLEKDKENCLKQFEEFLNNFSI